MFGLFRNKGDKKEKKEAEQQVPDLAPLDSYFKKELELCSEITEEGKDLAFQHMQHKVNLNKTGNKLSADEKKAANLNPRLSITTELFSILTEAGLKQEDPKRILSGIYYRATSARSRDESILSFKKAGIEKYSFMSSKDERDCAWCSSQDGIERPVFENPNQLISENCTCESHCRCTLKPIIKY